MIMKTKNIKLLSKAWDITFENTVVPLSNWPIEPELRPKRFEEIPAYFYKFLKALGSLEYDSNDAQMESIIVKLDAIEAKLDTIKSAAIGIGPAIDAIKPTETRPSEQQPHVRGEGLNDPH